MGMTLISERGTCISRATNSATPSLTQTFHDIAVDQAIRITEFATDYEKMEWTPVTVPKAEPVPGMMTRAK